MKWQPAIHPLCQVQNLNFTRATAQFTTESTSPKGIFCQPRAALLPTLVIPTPMDSGRSGNITVLNGSHCRVSCFLLGVLTSSSYRFQAKRVLRTFASG